MNKGNFITRTTCRLCHSTALVKVIDMGWMPLAGDYLKKEAIGHEKYYPLKIYYCKACTLVQVLDVVDPDVLFSDYRYLSSVGLSKHFDEYAKDMVVKKYLSKGSFAVEIGSNDGVLLMPLQRLGVTVLGVDPSRNVAQIAQQKGLNTLIGYFDEHTAHSIKGQYGMADAVLANNVLAHIDDLDTVFWGINDLLKPQGVLVFEVHYFPDLVANLQYDFFYNEHLNYYTIHSLNQYIAKFGMEIVNIDRIALHGGSVRVFVKKAANKRCKQDKSVAKLIAFERRRGFTSIAAVSDFSHQINRHKESLVTTLTRLRSRGNSLVGYGAAGRANTLLNFCHIGPDILEYVVDESPERFGRFIPGMHIPIVEPSVFRNHYPDYALLLAWSYKEMITAKEQRFLDQGGKFIVPLPKLKVV